MYTEEEKFRQTEATVIKSMKNGKGVLRSRISKSDFGIIK